MGLHAGYGWSDVDVQLKEPALAVAVLDFLGAPTRASHEVDGFLVGGHIGFQQQFGRWVIGIEGSLSGGELDGRSRDDFAGYFAIGGLVLFD